MKSAFRIVIVASMVAALGACSTTGGGKSGSRAIVRSVVEPGDTTMSCSELDSEIRKVASIVKSMGSNLHDLERKSSWTSSLSSFVVNNSYSNSYGSSFGPLQSMFADIGRTQSQQDIAHSRQNLATAKGRKDHLTSIYNQRCF